MVFQLLSVHDISEEMAPGDVRRSVQMWCAVAIEELGETCYPSCCIEKAQTPSPVWMCNVARVHLLCAGDDEEEDHDDDDE